MKFKIIAIIVIVLIMLAATAFHMIEFSNPVEDAPQVEIQQ